MLDDEWRRRFPERVGNLACHKCALNTYWTRRKLDGTFVAGHRAAPGGREDQDHDAWDHVDGGGTHAAMIYLYPYSAVQQGVEAWLRYIVRRPQLDSGVRARIQNALDRWDSGAL